MSVLPAFPVDDETLDLIALAIDTPDLAVANVLEGLSTGVIVEDEDGDEYSYCYHLTDVVRALIDEVRRLRSPVLTCPAPLDAAQLEALKQAWLAKRSERPTILSEEAE